MAVMPVEERERRRSARQLVELSVHFRHLGRPEETYEDIARNISMGGVFIETSVGLPLGTPLWAEISFEGDTPPVTVEGEVVRVEEQAVTCAKGEPPVRGLAVEFRPGQPALEALMARIKRLEGGEGSS